MFHDNLVFKHGKLEKLLSGAYSESEIEKHIRLIL